MTIQHSLGTEHKIQICRIEPAGKSACSSIECEVKKIMRKRADRKIILEDGQEYYGYSFGSGDEKMLEIVFNTSMVGYQEILSDPSYTDQAVVMTCPLISS